MSEKEDVFCCDKTGAPVCTFGPRFSPWIVEILWASLVDMGAAESIVLKSFEDRGSCLFGDSLWTEDAPLRRKCGSVFDN